MFLTIGIILLAIWVGGFFFFHILGGLIHLALILGLASIVWHWIRKGQHQAHSKP